jgi:hypothetical protein
MNLQNRLDQFRSDNPYDNDTQAKRLLATDDKELILYVLALGLATAKQRQRHLERDFIKNRGQAPPRERFVPGRTTGSVSVVKIKPSKRMQNAMQQLIVDVWKINGELPLGDATTNDLTVAETREQNSSIGHTKNAVFYGNLKKELTGSEIVRNKWSEQAIRSEIETVYGEFRSGEAA